MLIKCPECGKEVSDKAQACIHCGYPIKKETNSLNAITQTQTNTSNNSTICKINRMDYDFSEFIRLYEAGFPFKASCKLSEIWGVKTMKEVPQYLLLYYEEHKCFPTELTTSNINITKDEMKKINDIITKYMTTERQTKRTTKICPKCNSTELTPLRRKWTLFGGFATNKVDMVCSKCGTVVK